MGKSWIGAALVVGLAVMAANAVWAQQGPTSPAQSSAPQPSIMDPDEPDQASPPAAKPPRHKQKAAQAQKGDPDLDTNDQLAPSQMKQPMPAAVAEPGSPGASAPAHRSAEHVSPDTAFAPPAAAPRPATVRAAAPGAHVVACTGIFGKDSSHLRLAMTYETKNITFADVDASGGAKVPASVLYPNDPKRRLEVWWSNPAERSQTYLIVINGQSTWTAPDGMRLGLTLAQLEKLNHRPFKLKGFDKDGVATISDWDDGTLATLPGGCKSGLSLRADPKVSKDAVSAMTADQEFSSSDPAIRAVKPTVSEILIGY